jgi:hypothetical protein
MVRKTIFIIGFLLLAAACATGSEVVEPLPSTIAVSTTSPTSTTIPATTTTTVPGGGVLVTQCGLAEFAFGTTELVGGPFDEEAQRAFDQAGEAITDETGPFEQDGELVDGEWFGEGSAFGGGWEWLVIERDDTRMVFLGEGPNGYADVTIERDGDTWQAAGFGGCRFMTSTTLAEFGIGAWVAAPGSVPDPHSSTLDVLVMERECASGQPPVGREIRPVVLSGEEVLEIVVLIEAPGGLAQTCQGNPWHRTTIDVGEPIGERTLVDGHVSPGLVRPWPATETSMGSLGQEE